MDKPKLCGYCGKSLTDEDIMWGVCNTCLKDYEESFRKKKETDETEENMPDAVIPQDIRDAIESTDPEPKITYMDIPTGWICPICKTIYSPFQSHCLVCNSFED